MFHTTFWINILINIYWFESTCWINILINICFLDQHIGSTSCSTYFILDQHFGSTSKLNWINMDQHPDQHRHLGILMKIHAIIAAPHAVFCFILASSPHTVRFSISSWFHHIIPCGFLFRTDPYWINILDQHWLIKMLNQNVDPKKEAVDPNQHKWKRTRIWLIYKVDSLKSF